MVKNVSEVMLSCLPSFWKICRSFLDGKFKKVSVHTPAKYAHIFTIDAQNLSTSSRRSPTQVRTMALDVIKQYIALFSEFFMLSDAAVVTNSPGPDGSPTPPLLPRDSNALTTMHHLMKILGEIQETVNEVNGMDISSEATSSLKGFMESARWKFEDILVHNWLRGDLPTVCLPSGSYLLPLRCKRVLSPRELARVNLGSLYYCVSLTDPHFPEANDYRRFQDRGRR